MSRPIIRRGNDLYFPKGNERGEHYEPLYIASGSLGKVHGRTREEAARLYEDLELDQAHLYIKHGQVSIRKGTAPDLVPHLLAAYREGATVRPWRGSGRYPGRAQIEFSRKMGQLVAFGPLGRLGIQVGDDVLPIFEENVVRLDSTERILWRHPFFAVDTLRSL